MSTFRIRNLNYEYTLKKNQKTGKLECQQSIIVLKIKATEMLMRNEMDLKKIIHPHDSIIWTSMHIF